MNAFTPYTMALNNAENKRNAAAAKQAESEKLAKQSAALLAEAEAWDKAAAALKPVFEP